MPDSFRKVLKDKPFTVLDNEALRDSSLSLKARGMLCTCMSLPPDWRFSVRGLAAICKEGREAVASALSELERAGYLRRNKLQGRSEDGTFGGTEYVFYETPQPWPGNPATDEPATDNPCTDEPSTENPPQINTKQQKKEQSPPKAPRGGRKAKSAPNHEAALFERFWKAYPRGEDRQGAIKEWDHLQPDLQLMRIMSAALERQKLTLSAEDPHDRYPFPYACRWIKYRRWEDDLAKGRGVGSPPAKQRTVEAPEEVARW